MILYIGYVFMKNEFVIKIVIICYDMNFKINCSNCIKIY